VSSFAETRAASCCPINLARSSYESLFQASATCSATSWVQRSRCSLNDRISVLADESRTTRISALCRPSSKSRSPPRRHTILWEPPSCGLDEGAGFGEFGGTTSYSPATNWRSTAAANTCSLSHSYTSANS
jgi:hypothetical protein